jgi:FkbM family methyltransferase
LIQAILRKAGFHLTRFYDPCYLTAKRIEILRESSINLVLDIGANTGQYAETLRANGFRGRVISFEPTSEAFAALSQKAASDERWSCEQLALSDREGPRVIKLSANSWSSSLLPLAARGVRSAPDSVYVGSEVVTTSCLDTLAPRVFHPDDSVLLKLDVQGHELAVLRGGERALALIEAVESELSVVPLYQGQSLIGDVLAFLSRLGFELVALEPGYADPHTGQVLQLDGLFVRSPASRRVAASGRRAGDG